MLLQDKGRKFECSKGNGKNKYTMVFTVNCDEDINKLAGFLMAGWNVKEVKNHDVFQQPHNT